jgi:drug/metabolite transporter (DMT)-like permease
VVFLSLPRAAVSFKTMTTSLTDKNRIPALWIHLAFAYVYLAWGGTYLAVHIAIESWPPFLLAGVRFLLAGLLLLGILRVLHPEQFAWGTVRQWRQASVVGILLLVTGIGIVNWAQQWISSSMAALLFGAIPLWITLIEWLRPRGQAPGLRTAFGLGLGFAGLCLLLAPGTASLSSGPLFGKFLVLAAALSWATGALYSRHLPVQGSPFLPMARQMIAAGCVLLVLSTCRGDWSRFSPKAVTGPAWLAFFYLVICGSVLGFTAYLWLMRVSSPARTSTIPYVNLMIAVLLGWKVNHEAFHWNLALGAGTIIGSVILVLQKPEEAAGGD